MNRIAKIVVAVVVAVLTISYLGCDKITTGRPEVIPPFTGELIFTDFSPQRAIAGDVITLFGNFSDHASQNTVSFNGVEGEVTSSTGETLKVRVPEGDCTGKIEVAIGDKNETLQKMFVLLPGYSIDFMNHHTIDVFHHLAKIHPYEFDNKIFFTDSYRVYLYDLLNGSYQTLVEHSNTWVGGFANAPPSDCVFTRPIRIAYYTPTTALFLIENDGNYYSAYEVNENIVNYRGTTTNNWRKANDIFYANGEIYLINREYGQTGVLKSGQTNFTKIRTIPGVIGMNSDGDFFSYQDYKLYRTDNDGQETVFIAGSSKGDVDGKGEEAKFNYARFLYADSDYIYVLDNEMSVSFIKKVNITDGMVTTIFVFDRTKDINLANLELSSVAFNGNVIYSIHNRDLIYKDTRETIFNRIVLDF